MGPDLEEFRQRVIAHAKLVIGRAAKVESEASTNASLVQPFLTTLGYDVLTKFSLNIMLISPRNTRIK
jgi:hypothetical protein